MNDSPLPAGQRKLLDAHPGELYVTAEEALAVLNDPRFCDDENRDRDVATQAWAEAILQMRTALGELTGQVAHTKSVASQRKRDLCITFDLAIKQQRGSIQGCLLTPATLKVRERLYDWLIGPKLRVHSQFGALIDFIRQKDNTILRAQIYNNSATRLIFNWMNLEQGKLSPIINIRVFWQLIEEFLSTVLGIPFRFQKYDPRQGRPEKNSVAKATMMKPPPLAERLHLPTLEDLVENPSGSLFGKRILDFSDARECLGKPVFMLLDEGLLRILNMQGVLRTLSGDGAIIRRQAIIPCRIIGEEHTFAVEIIKGVSGHNTIALTEAHDIQALNLMAPVSAPSSDEMPRGVGKARVILPEAPKVQEAERPVPPPEIISFAELLAFWQKPAVKRRKTETPIVYAVVTPANTLLLRRHVVISGIATTGLPVGKRIPLEISSRFSKAQEISLISMLNPVSDKAIVVRNDAEVALLNLMTSSA